MCGYLYKNETGSWAPGCAPLMHLSTQFYWQKWFPKFCQQFGGKYFLICSQNNSTVGDFFDQFGRMFPEMYSTACDLEFKGDPNWGTITVHWIRACSAVALNKVVDHEWGKVIYLWRGVFYVRWPLHSPPIKISLSSSDSDIDSMRYSHEIKDK